MKTKTLNFIIWITILTGTLFSCNSDDDRNTAARSSGSIDVFIDGSSTPTQYASNIQAADNPLPQSTGFSTVFKIEARETGGSVFRFSLAPGTTVPTVVNTPATEIITGPISQRLRIDGLLIDDSASNALTVSYTQFGANTGDPIKLSIIGTYFINGDTNAHTIDCQIDITRD
ncbi:hypothetical protein [Leeuwenhoekiella parthenopeia]|uniref:Lipoprotein n=1 Tax=Leeuwenhoekiella parthenopeia TaxID=2890320 RepID=A0ABS8GRX2_9FLAO|nr:hypothetical protein [Leeuwenhoekiella parthenopeia]MCC4212736.1 hypothetical protein [Leeuwenhoekiella parthenopeia]